MWWGQGFRYSWRPDTLDSSGADIVTSGCKPPDMDAGIKLGSSTTVIHTFNS